jgi:hypothetical protein
VNNKSDYELKLTLSLYQKQNYCFTKLKSRINNEESFDYIEPRLKCYSKRILLSIPSSLKTMSFESKLITLSYEIRASIEILKTKDSLRVELPVVLTIPPKNCNSERSNSYSDSHLPPSYSDCQIFHRIASEDVCFPSVPESKSDQIDEKDPKSPIFVDLPPSYAEAVFGFESLL